MSFADRMRQVRSAAELDALMAEVRQRGSSDWTFDVACIRVRRALWPQLEKHFGEDGRILPPDELDSDPSGEASAASIVAAIEQLNARVRAIRVGGASASSAQPVGKSDLNLNSPFPTSAVITPPDEPSDLRYDGADREQTEGDGAHHIEDGWCVQCGISHEQAGVYLCN